MKRSVKRFLFWLMCPLVTFRQPVVYVWFIAISVWLFHPFSINVSTRGNADAVIGLLVLWALYLLLTKRVILSAIVYGLAVHFKIYPIVYALALLVFLDENYLGKPSAISKGSIWSKCVHFMNRDRVLFSIVSAGTFLGITGGFYIMYGFEFLFETYLYHFIRTDNRHNFSVYFYDLYLRYVTVTNSGQLGS